MRFWLIALIVFNIVDAISTLVGLEAGGLYEANPLMRGLISFSPVLFLVAKLVFCVPLVIALVRKEQVTSFIASALKILTITYGILMIWHLVMWIRYM